jgi:hypothetical protein
MFLYRKIQTIHVFLNIKHIEYQKEIKGAQKKTRDKVYARNGSTKTMLESRAAQLHTWDNALSE